MKRELPRIYVDFNTMLQDEESRVWLPTSVDPELLAFLVPGARVVLFDESIEVDAVVERIAPGEWWARPEPGTYRELVAPEPVGARERT